MLRGSERIWGIQIATPTVAYATIATTLARAVRGKQSPALAIKRMKADP
jgi:hypothetical protein